MAEILTNLIQQLCDFLWGWPMVIALLGTHLFLTVRLKFPQRKLLKAIRLSVTPDKSAKGDVSQFGALATALAATIGTGNIIGVGTAITLGGPGAVFWCWLTGVFGIATKYAEGLLAVKYRVRTPDGNMAGGPMYALERGMGMKWLAVLFALFTVVASFGIGNMVQSNAISLLCYESYGVPHLWSGLFIAVCVALVVIFGVKGIARVCTTFVPLIAVLYIIGCLYILYINGSYVWDALELILVSAFDPKAVGGGFVGGTIIMTARYGIARGLFSNESGMGSAPIVAAVAQTRNPVRQALVSSTGTFWDTVVICALTGLVLVSSILAYPDITYSDGAILSKEAFDKIPYIGAPLLTFGIITFAFSTILGWCYYGEKAMEYLKGKKWMLVYRGVFIVTVFIGATVQLAVVWNLADIANALMAIPNMISLIVLSGIIAKETQKYLWDDKLDDTEEEY
ncbi:MAG: alanine:cation symporter family protein [Bacteroidaceae bacterium]|nr:alanine:cation symporter family protein [Bacteroidaceae bacterium]